MVWHRTRAETRIDTVFSTTLGIKLVAVLVPFGVPFRPKLDVGFNPTASDTPRQHGVKGADGNTMFGSKKNKGDEQEFDLRITEHEAAIIGRLVAACAESALGDSHYPGQSTDRLDAMADVFQSCGLLLNKLHETIAPEQPRPDVAVYEKTAQAIRSGWDTAAVDEANAAMDNVNPEFAAKMNETMKDPEFQKFAEKKEREIRRKMGAGQSTPQQGGSWGL